jgi:DNA-binding HxlR family transcriptional regulator
MMVGPAIQHVQRRLSGISPKMSTRTLRQLEPAPLLTIFPGVPPGLSMRWPNSARALLPAHDHSRLGYPQRDESLSARRRSKKPTELHL